jgi:ribosomal protein S18 acetylase RimI-like enzyme
MVSTSATRSKKTGSGSEEIFLRPMVREDVGALLRLTDREGWEYSERDLFRLWETAPQGCLVAVEGEARIGFVTAVSYTSLGWIGNLVVAPEARERGLGTRLLRQALAHLESRGIQGIGLSSYPWMTDFYRREGFREVGRVATYVGEVPGRTQKPEGIREVRDPDWEEIGPLEEASFGDPRPGLLRRFWEEFPDLSLVAGREEIEGYLFGRSSPKGGEIGPWVALSPEAASSLLEAAFGRMWGRLWIHPVEENSAARELLEEKGFHRVFETVRMMRGEATGRGGASWAIGGLEWG